MPCGGGVSDGLLGTSAEWLYGHCEHHTLIRSSLPRVQLPQKSDGDVIQHLSTQVLHRERKLYTNKE